MHWIMMMMMMMIKQCKLAISLVKFLLYTIFNIDFSFISQ